MKTQKFIFVLYNIFLSIFFSSGILVVLDDIILMKDKTKSVLVTANIISALLLGIANGLRKEKLEALRAMPEKIKEIINTEPPVINEDQLNKELVRETKRFVKSLVEGSKVFLMIFLLTTSLGFFLEGLLIRIFLALIIFLAPSFLISRFIK